MEIIMIDLTEYTCCFFGHREIAEKEELKTRLFNEIENLIIGRRVENFLFGSKSCFDDLCYDVVSELKSKYNIIKRIYVRAEFPEINNEYREYLLRKYEDTYYPEKLIGAGKAAYVERNFEMIDNSNYCICYFDGEYTVSKKRKDRENSTGKSGTAIAYNYAVKKSKNIINVFNG